MLRAIVYVSSASRALSEEDLDFIVAEARRFNEASGVTGFLLYCGGNFMQYLEGEDDAVLQTFARIRASTRHRQVSELMNEPITVREFADWAMGFSQATPDGFLESAWGGLQDTEDCGPGTMLLNTFWASCR